MKNKNIEQSLLNENMGREEIKKFYSSTNNVNAKQPSLKVSFLFFDLYKKSSSIN
jgi:hypothetical protein